MLPPGGPTGELARPQSPSFTPSEPNPFALKINVNEKYIFFSLSKGFVCVITLLSLGHAHAHGGPCLTGTGPRVGVAVE